MKAPEVESASVTGVLPVFDTLNVPFCDLVSSSILERAIVLAEVIGTEKLMVLPSETAIEPAMLPDWNGAKLMVAVTDAEEPFAMTSGLGEKDADELPLVGV